MNIITTTLVQGHRVASGENRDPRFPGGTIRMQISGFLERGLDLRSHFPATLNLSAAPGGYEFQKADHVFHQVDWHPREPPEDFSFYACEVRPAKKVEWLAGWIYYPHPDTKPEHFQPADLLEVLVERKISGLCYGDQIELRADPERVIFRATEETEQG